VPLITLDAYRREHRPGYIDFLKVDVEGFEQEVFFGMAQSIRESRLGVIQFEINAHNGISGLTLYQLTRLFPEYDMLKLLPNGWELLVGEGQAYNSRIEIYKYANLIALPRTGRAC
jgi:hypothetical protein